MVARHRYRESGVYTVKLTVTDDAGLPNSSTQAVTTVTVNAAPAPVITVAGGACFGQPVGLDAKRSRDADGAIRKFEWDLGDGARASGVEISHVYRDPGVYNVVITADVAGVAPTATRLRRRLSMSTVRLRHRLVRIVASALVTPSSSTAAVRSTGTASSRGTAGISLTGLRRKGRGFPMLQQARYVSGPATVTDDFSSPCANAEAVSQIHVNAPPQASLGGDREAFTGGAHDQLLFDASGSSDPDGSGLEYSWDLGHGTSRAGEKLRHAYDRPGVYKVRLTVRDGTGLLAARRSAE